MPIRNYLGVIKAPTRSYTGSIGLTRNNNISLNIQWISRELKKTRDLISKFIYYDDWVVTENYFKFIHTKLEPVNIDRIATKQNTKTERFNSKVWS